MKLKPYPSYKDSGVEWLGDVPEWWAIDRLKRACEVFPSNVDKKSVEGETEVRLCNYTDVYYKGEITGDLELMKATATQAQIDKFTLRKDDVIITKDSETADDIGIPAYVPNDLPGVVCGYHLSMIRPRANVSGKYIKRLFDSHYLRAKLEIYAQGLTRVGLGQYEIDNLDIPMPPHGEQSTIATFLDRETAKLDTLIAKQERLIELLQEKRQAVISHAVTKGLDTDVPMKDSGVEWMGEVPEHWDIIKIKWLFEIKKRISGEIGYDVLSITQNGIKIKDTESGDGQLSMDYSKYQFVEVGDFAMNHMDLLTGYVDISRYHGVTSPDYRVFSIRNEAVTANQYFLYLFQMAYKNKLFFPFGQGSSQLGRWRLPTEQFNDFLFPLPAIDEQQAIAKNLDKETTKIDKLIEKSKRSIELAKEHRAALISAAVTGKIDVRNYA